MAIFKPALGLVLALTLGACAADKTIGTSPNIQVTDLTSLPRPTNANTYTIEPMTELEVSVFQAPELSGTYLTDENGNLTLPVAGSVAAAGETPGTLARKLEVRLAEKFLKDPQVQVRPTTIAPPSVTVGGQVENPGTYPVATSRSLMRAVINAGDAGEYADSEDVLIFRTVDGQRYIGLYNLSGIRRGNYDDPPLYAGDIVSVGDSPRKRALEKFLQIAPLITNTLVLIDRVSDNN